MKFEAIDPGHTGERTYILLNETSYFISISKNGLDRTDTGYPQKGVDYDKQSGCRRVKVTGIDEI